MLAVCLHKLCTQDGFETRSSRLDLCGNCSPAGGKAHRGAPKTAFSAPPGGRLDARWALFCCEDSSEADSRRLWGALGALLAALGAVLKPLEPPLGCPGPLLGDSWRSCLALPGAELDVLDDFGGAT